MAYEKTTWTKRIVQYPDRYTLNDLGGGVYEIAPSPGSITQAGTPLTEAALNNLETQYDCAKAEIDALAARVDTVTHSEPSRAFNTIYQNTSGYIRMVTATIALGDTTGGGWAKVEAFCDSNASPSTLIAKVYFDLATDPFKTIEVPMTFIVPPGHYYKLQETENYGNVYLREWHEWDLHPST